MIEKSRTTLQEVFRGHTAVPWFILGAVTLIFTLLLYPKLVVSKHSYQIGDVAKRDTKAPFDFFIEDEEVTQANRKRAEEESLTVYDHNTGLLAEITRTVTTAFADQRRLAQTAAQAATPVQPVTETDIPAVPLQTAPVTTEATVTVEQGPDLRKILETQLGLPLSADAYESMAKEGFSSQLAAQIVTILSRILKTGVVANKEILLKEANKGIVLTDLTTKAETIVLKIDAFHDLDQAKVKVREIGRPLLKKYKYSLRNVVMDLTERLLQPNITLNRSATQERRQSAVTEVKPVLYQIKAGEMILREGERINELQLLKLTTLQAKAQDQHLVTASIGAAMLMVALLLCIYLLSIRNQPAVSRSHNKDLLFLATTVVTSLFLVKANAVFAETLTRNAPFEIAAAALQIGAPLAAGAMVICLFLRLQTALAASVILAVGAAALLQYRLDIFIYFLVSCSMGAYWVQDCRERKVFIKSGLKLGLLNTALVSAIYLYLGAIDDLEVVWGWVFVFLSGISAGIITAGLTPLMEWAFDYTTDIKLLELANLDQPILRRLMIEAPGTYNHSVIVGTMVEAAAAEIGANPLLAKVCGYYHDIGKFKKPLYFIENQRNGKNKHDKLAPSMSSLILTAHVKDGVEIAREHKLGQPIIDTIRQHHGTSLITYFFEKAKQKKGEDAVNIDDYRYPGPKPQTREAGLVMLADVVEAASRTLDNPTPSRIQGLVQNLTNKIFSDGQLDNCELTLKDLHNIAKSYNKILNGIHHHRIEYTEKGASVSKVKDGSTDRQQTKQTSDLGRENKENGTGHLKRLGLS